MKPNATTDLEATRALESDAPRREPGGDDLGRVLREYTEVASRLYKTHEVLQGEVVRLREELASKDRELELRRRLAALGELAAGVAHEVRNPLGAIRLYSDLLRDQCAARNLEPALQLIEKIEAGIQAIDAVVQDTLALAPRDRHLEVCDLRVMVQRAQDAAAGALEARQVGCEVVCELAAARVRADAHGLQRVLVNLLVNAVEASAAGQTVTVTVAELDDQQLSVRVADRGPGLPDEIRHRIFDPFFTTKPHGTGLGLTIAHRLIEAYGGRMTAGNRLGGGAEFTVALPRAASAGTTAASAADARHFSAA